ncbi:MAG: FAD-dependent oxidoreductase [Proteobacteria bacterium]|nr:FAD-dependent oxidoreductase [Pseudomonadota bacterium]
MKKLLSIGQLEWFRNEIRAAHPDNKTRLLVCMTGCRAYGAADVLGALKQEVERQGLVGAVEIRSTGCHGFCAKAPVVAIEPLGIQYQEVSPDDAPDIVRLTIKENRLIDRLAYRDTKTDHPVFHKNLIPFYKHQTRRILANCGRIDPTQVDHYIGAGGYQALSQVLGSMNPDQVIRDVLASRLRGRGGAGFPTGRKWELARASKGSPKYIICNADEGDPGAFMDRALLEGDPHAVIEGLMIGAYAMGASKGYIYVREEYPIAVQHLGIALDQLRGLGLLGDNILGKGFFFDIELKMGAGAFVCGEETALMASIESRRGMPSARPPFPAQSGLDKKPSNINNVETLANIPLIFSHGVNWYTEVGTENSKGTKIFSLAGKVNNTGLVEVPIGMRLNEIIFDIGGGIPKGRKFKAVQMGGPSGGCVPKEFLNLPVDYDTLQKIGAIMGSGGMVVMDENNCMVEIARFFLGFTQSESCGKCAPCRLGTTQMLAILTRITQGKGRLEDLEALRSIGKTVSETSLCGLGQTCAKPALSTLRYFLKEYEEHIHDMRCAGAVCDSMVISPCQHACPAGIDVPNYVAAVALGHYAKAVDIIRERNPFPAVCGRICIHPCEFKCRRGELDDPVSIRLLKRFAADWYFDNMDLPDKPFPVTRSKKVAVVGAGPAGLTCAYYLAQAGYKTAVFESKERGGGMLEITMPEFRLPREVILKEIEYIERCGVNIHYKAPIDAGHTVNDLISEGYGAVFIAAGAQASKRLEISGEDESIPGIYYGLKYLADIKAGIPIPLQGRVIVIGGGNVALDVARTAIRTGASAVQIFYRRTIEEMPAWGKEIEEALDEGILINPLWAPHRIIHEGGVLKGIEFAKSRTVNKDDGTSRLEVDKSSTRTVDAEAIIISIGQAPDASFLSRDSRVERNLWGSLAVDKNNLSTTIPGIFAGGDFTTGPSSVIQAIASGRRAALSIENYLEGRKGALHIRDEKTHLYETAGLALDQDSSDEKRRARPKMESPGQRKADFREVEAGFTEKQAMFEAMRCLRCDLEKEGR